MREMDRQQLLARLTAEFPEVAAQIRDDEAGLLHYEVAAFRRATGEALDSGHLWSAERHFRFVAEMLAEADPQLRNALEISYVEDLALGDFSPERHAAVKSRMPRSSRALVIEYNPRWKWSNLFLGTGGKPCHLPLPYPAARRTTISVHVADDKDICEGGRGRCHQLCPGQIKLREITAVLLRDPFARLDLHARDSLVRAPNDENAVAYVHLGNGDVDAAVRKLGHNCQVAAAARE